MVERDGVQHWANQKSPAKLTDKIFNPLPDLQLSETMPLTSVFAAGNTALITGGASGIGLAVAQLCRKHGMRVAVVDYNKEALAKAKETLQSSDVEAYDIDVSKLEQWKGLKESVEKRFGTVDFLMLNAGIGLRGTWGDDDYFQKVY
jgi:NAD(P)-dependent dehydrogenase (short-subunit alcohol dehydrogenase family)